MKKLLYLLVGFLFFIILMPRVQMYYTLEKELQKYNITINEKDISDIVAFQASDIKIYFEDIHWLDAKSIDIYSAIFYNKIQISDIKVSSVFKDLIGLDISFIKATYSVIDIFNINFKVTSSIGDMNGYFNLKSNTFKLTFKAKENFVPNATIRNFFKKTKEGYVYEKTF